VTTCAQRTRGGVAAALAAFTVALGLVAGCYPGGPESLDEIGTVITYRNPDGRHSGMRTYAMEDSVAELDNPSATTSQPLDRRFDPAILDEIQVQLEGAGFRRVDPDQERPDAWVAVGSVQSDVWLLWYTWGYWGGYWGGGWRPPLSPGIGGTSFKQGTVLWELFDLRDLPDPIPTDPEPVVNWVAAINGAVQGTATTESDIRRGIGQAFDQSSYIQAVPDGSAR